MNLLILFTSTAQSLELDSINCSHIVNCLHILPVVEEDSNRKMPVVKEDSDQEMPVVKRGFWSRTASG
jgi:hypothetical protein